MLGERGAWAAARWAAKELPRISSGKPPLLCPHLGGACVQALLSNKGGFVSSDACEFRGLPVSVKFVLLCRMTNAAKMRP